MLARVRTAAVFGIDAFPVLIEVDLAYGLPGLTIVGLPDAAVRESRERVRTAIRNSGFDFPMHRITVNLAPADVRKDGALRPADRAGRSSRRRACSRERGLDDVLVVGELSLDGGVQPARGVLPIAAAARRAGSARSSCRRRTPPRRRSSTGAECIAVRHARARPSR